MNYTVEVNREDDVWHATVLELEGVHMFAETYCALEGHVREVIALAQDLPAGEESAFELNWVLGGALESRS
ncbi:hypothetical protein [Corynebacterium liangguodongii]|uniref:hypothetical protein n=1 Tax=Corynebacterium liangguodongii TaxID=2079535 RepID=UPI0011B1F182|nr:hypothetical protein [Corynebacterium liangguodongii]